VPRQVDKNVVIAHRRESDGSIQSLEEHLHAVANLAARNADKIGLGFAGELMGLLHDLGKYSTEFQNYIKSATGILDPDLDEDAVDADALKGKIDHSTAGAQILWEHFIQPSMASKYRPLGQVLALAIASHHSGLIDCIGSFGAGANYKIVNLFLRRMAKEENKAHQFEVLAKADESISSRVKKILTDETYLEAFSSHVESLIKRDKDGAGYNDKSRCTFKLGLTARFLFSCLIDADRVDSANFEMPSDAKLRQGSHYIQWNVLINRLDHHLASFNADSELAKIRRHISDTCLARASDCTGIYSLTVPTGGGKTLASLRFALHHAQHHGLERIIYVAPFTSIIDQNAQVVRDILERPECGDRFGTVVLEHHSNLSEDEKSWQAKILSESWDSPIVFTTCVQFLEALFRGGTRAARRLHQLAKAVIVIDEAQSLPIKCIHMLNNALNAISGQWGTTVLLCTASQPLLHRVCGKKGALNLRAITAELIPDVPALFSALKRVNIRDLSGESRTIKDLAKMASAYREMGLSALFILNTKRAAKELYEAICGESDYLVYHLSTNMCPAHRVKMLGQIREKLSSNEPVLAVSTQLIEAGVDVDFARVVRSLAGLDSIAQAAGRCNRNGRQAGMGEVVVVKVESENLDKLYEIKQAQNSGARVLREFSSDALSRDILDPCWMEIYFNYYFFQRQDEMVYKISRDVHKRDDSLLNLLADNNHDASELSEGENSLPLMQAFKTAGELFRVLDQPTRGVVVPYGEEGKRVVSELHAAHWPEHKRHLVKAQRYSVNIWPHEFDELFKNNALKLVGGKSEVDIYTLDSRYYTEGSGLQFEAAELLEVLCV
jgi:CRISPR-associated endonuclease/helicase Cas3